MRTWWKYSFLLLFTSLGKTASAQDVSNDQTIFYQVFLYQLDWRADADDGADEPAWKFNWGVNFDNSYNSCSNAGWPVTSNNCFRFTSGGKHTVNREWAKKNNPNAPGSVTDKFNYNFIAWENDDLGTADCESDSDDDLGHCGTGYLNIKFGNPTEWISFTLDGFQNRSATTTRWVWRYKSGESLNDPIKFDDITNVWQTHYNSNRSAPSGSDAAMGYANKEVFYSFSLTTASKVYITTQNASTNFNTVLTLYKNDNTFITSNDNISSTILSSAINHDLCAGTYKIKVSGSGGATGNFILGIITNGSPSITGGSITQPTKEQCTGADLPAIDHASNASTQLGNINYSWQTSTNAIDWQSIAGAGTSLSNPGKMGDKTVYYRRIASASCNPGTIAYSNIVSFTVKPSTEFAGEVYPFGASVLKTNSFPPPIFSLMDASASPAPFTIFWQISTDLGVNKTWTDIASQKEQSLFYDTRLSQTTYFRRGVKSACGGVKYSNLVEIKVIPSIGIVKGFVRSRNGAGIVGVKVSTEEVIFDGDQAKIVERSTLTNQEGFYQISDLFLGETGADFTITPTLTNHGFSPGSITRKLTPTAPVQDNINFTDTTVFTVSGKISQEGCALAGVKIFLDGVQTVYRTDEQGNYNIPIQNPGTYTLAPDYRGHKFDPASKPVLVNGDVKDVNFNDVQSYKLSGFVRAGCNQYLGTATLMIRDSSNCIRRTINTNTGSGYYEISLPARPYLVEVAEVSPLAGLDKNEIKSFFNKAQAVDLTISPDTADFTFHHAPYMEVTGLPAPPNCNGIMKSILEQNKSYDLTINIWEGNSKTCVLDTGVIIINDQIGDLGSKSIMLPVSKGQAKYTLVAGDPNLLGDFSKLISLTGRDTFARSFKIDRSAIVTGARAREKTFTTVTPNLPLFILRDPPGDGSYSYLEENTTVETATRFYALDNETNNLWGKIKVGHEGLEGAGVGITFLTKTSFWDIIGTSYTVSGTTNASNEVIVSMTNSKSFSTSDNESVTGEAGDVVIGAAMNLIYAIADELNYDMAKCALVQSKSLVIANKGFKTTYIYTTEHIRDFIIPQLKADLVDVFQKNKPDSALYFQNQISVWEQILSQNEELKSVAEFKENISFSGNARHESSTSGTTSKTSSIEFLTEINKEVSDEIGLELAGSGVSGGGFINLKTESGKSESTTNLKELKTGFVLYDDDGGDRFSVDVKTDPVYKTPVFELKAGTSSCPYEPGTRYRDNVQLTVENPVITNVASDGTAVFNLKLGNISQNEELRSYLLAFNPASNPDGAKITVNGSPYILPIRYDIPYGAQIMVTVEVKRGPNVFAFPNLEFSLYPECDEELEKSVALSAYFSSPCSPITIAEPGNGWIINKSSNHRLKLQLEDYNLNNLDQVVAQVAAAGTNNWKTVSGALPLTNSAFGTEVELNFENLVDGEYDLRLKINCGINVGYSEVIRGRMDRIGPELFGIPSPAGDLLNASTDEISAQFSEILDCNSVNNKNVTIKNITKNIIYSGEASCFGNKLIVLPGLNLGDYAGDVFNVSLTGIKDLAGNVEEKPVSWNFIVTGGQNVPVNTIDSDNDGVTDAFDLCPQADDRIDSDADGMPDACDLCPQTANSGLNFDGINDYMSITGLKLPAGNFTMESWVKYEKNNSIAPVTLFDFGDGNPWIGFRGDTLSISSKLNAKKPFSQNEWVHIAVVYNQSQDSLKMFINGDFVASVKGNSFNKQGTNLGIGQRYNSISPNSFFKGSLDELRIWNVDKNAVQIKQAQFKELGGKEEGLIIYLNFNDGVPFADNTKINQVADLSTNGYLAMLHGFNLFGPSSNFSTGSLVSHFDDNQDGLGDICQTQPDKVTLILGKDICGAKGSTVKIPIMVKNFSEIRGMDFSVKLSANAPGIIIGVENFNLRELTANNFSIIDSGKGLFASWFTRDNVTLEDDVTIFNILLQLSGEPGANGLIVFSDDPQPVVIFKNNNATDHNLNNGNFCVTNDNFNLEGKITTRKVKEISNVKVSISGSPGNDKNILTNASGTYVLADIKGGNYVMGCNKDNDLKNGLNVGDLITIQDHILNRRRFTLPEEYIAADVDKSKAINVGDLILLQDVILSRVTSFPNNASWQFIPTSEDLTIDKARNHTYQTTRLYNPLTTNQANQDFWGIKIGDVDFSANSKSAQPDPAIKTRGRQLASTITLSIPDQSVLPGAAVTIPVATKNFNGIRGLEFGVQWNPDVIKFKGVSGVNSNLTGLDDNSFDTSQQEGGLLKMLWFASNSVSLTDQAKLFSLQFEIIGKAGDSTRISFSDALAYNSNGALDSIDIVDGSITVIDPTSSTRITLKNQVSIRPNPVYTEMLITTGDSGIELVGISNIYGQVSPLRLKNANNFKVDLSGYPSGIYYLIILKGQKIENIPFVHINTN